MYAGVVDVKPLDDFRLLVTFDNTERRIFDVGPYLGMGMFAQLRDLAKFQSVRVEFDTIAWNNGADIDPEVLYEDSIPLNQ
jgi:hypothetical protein